MLKEEHRKNVLEFIGNQQLEHLPNSVMGDALSEKWIEKWLERHGELKTVNPIAMEAARAHSATKEHFITFFDNCISLFDKNKYHPSMVGNGDEMFITQGKSNAKVVVSSHMRSAFVKTPTITNHHTLCALIFQDGTSEDCLIVLPLAYMPSDIETNAYPRFNWTGQQKGWIDKDIWEKYCETVVIPAFERRRAKLGDPEARGLFLVDGHNSRINDVLMKKFNDAKIDVLCEVAHCSHIHQPADLMVFGIFKREFTLPAPAHGEPTTAELRKMLLDAADIAWQKASIPHYIKKGFERAGYFEVEPRVRPEIVLGHHAIMPSPIPGTPETIRPVAKRGFRISGTILTQRVEELRRYREEKEAKTKRSPKRSPKKTAVASPSVDQTPPVPVNRKKRAAPTPSTPHAPMIMTHSRKVISAVECLQCERSSSSHAKWLCCSYCESYWLCKECLENPDKLEKHSLEQHGKKLSRKRRCLTQILDDDNNTETD